MQQQAPLPSYPVNALPTRVIPTVPPLSKLTRGSIDAFKLAIEALRRANDMTPKDAFITEATQGLLTLKLLSSRQIDRRDKEEWKSWDDRKFFDVLNQEFPSDRHRSDDAYQNALSLFRAVKLDIDFTVNNSELNYSAKLLEVLKEIQGEESFTKSQRLEFVKLLVKNIGTGVETRTNPEQLRELHSYLRAKRITSVDKLLQYILRWVEPVRSMWLYGENSGWWGSRALSKDKPSPRVEPNRDRPPR